MTMTHEAVRARRYLLGEASEEECAAIEQEYLTHDDALERMAAAEDELIEDYLANQLDAAAHRRFEQDYLSTPHHRVRVEAIRRLSGTAQSAAPASTPPAHDAIGRKPRRGYWLALAASFVLVTSAALWLIAREPQRIEVAATPPSQPAPQDVTLPDASPRTIAPRVVAMTLSPVAVRSAGDAPALAVPAGTDVIAIHLERDADGRALTASRASIRTVAGSDVWQGPLVRESEAPPGTIGRLDVPASSLPADDYLVTLYGTDPAGNEQEWTQYFLRVRDR